MEGNKFVIMSALLVSLVVVVFGQIPQVEAAATVICCPNKMARTFYFICRIHVRPNCTEFAGCRTYNNQCPGGWYKVGILKNSTAGDNAVIEYCKSGCVSSVCGAISTLQNSDTSEVVNGAVEKCSNACSEFCTNKGSVITTVVETTA